MTITLAFDVYGTLINTHGLLKQLETLVGDKAQPLSVSWREKQLEYSFRRGLMNSYLPFTECTRSALEYACKLHKVELSDGQKQELLKLYGRLPAFDDTRAGLQQLDLRRFNCFAFSNGTEAAVRGLLEHAGITSFFNDVVSVDDLQTFKPNPATYDYFMQRSRGDRARSWLISSNPFDVIGARRSGMRAAWVQRTAAAIFDDWEVEPDLIVPSLEQIGDRILDYYTDQ